MEAQALQFFIACVTAAGFGIAIAAFGCGIGQGMGLKSAVEGIARNPESSGKVTVTMLIGLAMIESLCIYALVVALILIYAHPQSRRDRWTVRPLIFEFRPSKRPLLSAAAFFLFFMWIYTELEITNLNDQISNKHQITISKSQIKAPITICLLFVI